MKALPLIGAVFAMVVAGGASHAQTTMQPPMNDFNEAFYICDDGGSFMVDYDNNPPTTATMTTNNDSRKHALKRVQTDVGVKFEGEGVTFWTDGKTVRVSGTQKPYPSCKLKGG